MNPSIFFSRVFIQVYKGFYVRRIMYNVMYDLQIKWVMRIAVFCNKSFEINKKETIIHIPRIKST